MDYNPHQQAILARDIIDMARDYSEDPEVLEYISRMCFTLFMLFEDDPNKAIDWHELFSVYDKKYYDLKIRGESNVDEAVVDRIRRQAVKTIEAAGERDTDNT